MRGSDSKIRMGIVVDAFKVMIQCLGEGQKMVQEDV